MLSNALILALSTAPGAALPGPVLGPRPIGDGQIWLHAWLESLQSSARAAVGGLELASASEVSAEIDARLSEPRFAAFVREVGRAIGDHGSEILGHWPSYQDKLTRAAKHLRVTFPSAADDIDAALAATRDGEWALLQAERDHGVLTSSLAELEQLDDALPLHFAPHGREGNRGAPPAVRDAVLDGLRGTIAGLVLADAAQRGIVLAPELTETLARIWRTGALRYVRVVVSRLGFDFPGLPSRLGLERYVDVETIDEFAAWLGAPKDRTLGAFADCAEDVDEVTAYIDRARRNDTLRESDA